MSKTEARNTEFAMKGIAIIILMLHNLLHKCGFSLENEWEYLPERTDIFIDSLTNSGVAQIFGEILSFTGWSCVCVFAFLSGFGLERKYSSEPVQTSKFVWKHWLKLFLLMLPGTLFFIAAHWQNNSIRYLFSLTMLANLVDSNMLPIGIYWYFGFTFELYLLWLLIRRMNDRHLALMMPCFVIFQLCFADSPHMEYLKMNFFGWGQIFILGMIVARRGELRDINIAIGLLASILVIVTCLNKWTWIILTPFIIVTAIWSLASFAVKWKPSKKAFVWIGKLSALLFAIHPVMRAIVLKVSNGLTLNLYLVVTTYIVSSIAVAMLADKARNWSCWHTCKSALIKFSKSLCHVGKKK